MDKSDSRLQCAQHRRQPCLDFAAARFVKLRGLHFAAKPAYYTGKTEEVSTYERGDDLARSTFGTAQATADSVRERAGHVARAALTELAVRWRKMIERPDWIVSRPLPLDALIARFAIRSISEGDDPDREFWKLLNGTSLFCVRPND